MEYFSSIFGGGFSCPYEIGEKHGGCWGGWEHYQATATADKKPVSLFKMTANKTNAAEVENARNGVKRLRVTKHPRILSFEWAGEQESQKHIIFHLVTEPVTPLPSVLDELALSGNQKHEYLALGLRQVSQAAAFLNNQCKLVHGNVCWDSVLVTNDLDWKLGFLDLSTEHSLLSSSHLARNAGAIAPQYRPPELSKGSADGPVWAVDSWGLGCLIQEAFTGQALSGPEQLTNTTAIPKPLVPDYQKLLTSSPAKRLNPDKLMENSFLESDLVDTMHFLENLSIKEPLEKQRFFRTLQTAMPAFPEVVCTRKLLPLISAALSYGGAPAIALGCLLKIGKMLPEEEFRARVIPVLSSLFASPDQSIRTSLLDSVADYAPALPPSAVEATIFPQLSKGLVAPEAHLREATLKALLPLAPKLSQRTLNGPLLKHLAKLQVDEEPSIRANTTVLLGNIAPHLGAAACRRILLNAFTRALKDIYPPSRSAALKALMATSAYHSPHDAAGRIVPCIAPLMLDSSPDVRQVGCRAMDFFVKLLRKASDDIAKGVDPSKPPADATSAAEACKAASSVSSFLGWAMTTVSAVSASSTASAATAKPGGTAAAARPGPAAAAAAPPAPSGMRLAAPAPAAAASPPQPTARSVDAFDDGWGDDDDAFEDMDGGAAPEVDVGAVAAAAQEVAKVQPSLEPIRTSSKPSAGDGWGGMDSGWGQDDDGWGQGEAAPAPAVKPAPKRPAKAKPKLKLGVSRKNGGKAD
eukprot:jgi/Ulvmu1/9891/UM057_0047.1